MGETQRELPGVPSMPRRAHSRGTVTDFLAGAAVLALAATVFVVVRTVTKDEPRPAAGTCGSVRVDPVSTEPAHREGRLDYDAAPPSSGHHHPDPLPAQPLLVLRPGPADVVERAVHNLERGYVVIFFGQDVSGEDVRKVAAAARESQARKVLLVPWNRGAFDVGTSRLVLTAWGHRLPCAYPEPGTISAFWERYGGRNGIAPEKDAP